MLPSIDPSSMLAVLFRHHCLLSHLPLLAALPTSACVIPPVEASRVQPLVSC
jgi:hypothetical protein